MSYDLYLVPGEELDIDKDKFHEHFLTRPNYELEGDDRQQAFYTNDGTGVDFHFNWREGDEDDVRDELQSMRHIWFNVNYVRPEFFALEAAIEIEAAVSAFRADILDPQDRGMDHGPYTTEGFLRGWRHGNRVALHSVLKAAGDELEFPTLPTERSNQAWRWNYGRDELEAALIEADEGGFVPRIYPLCFDGATDLRLAVIWGIGLLLALPDIANALVLSEPIPRRRFLRIPLWRIWRPKPKTIGAALIESLPAPLEVRTVETRVGKVELIGDLGDELPANLEALRTWARQHATRAVDMLDWADVVDAEAVAEAAEMDIEFVTEDAYPFPITRPVGPT